MCGQGGGGEEEIRKKRLRNKSTSLGVQQNVSISFFFNEKRSGECAAVLPVRFLCTNTTL